MTYTILVTDGEQRAALALVRALGRSGHRVHVCSIRGRSIAGASRYCRDEVIAPDPLVDPPGFVSAIAAQVERVRPNVVLPVSEAALLAVLPFRAALGGTVLPFPDDATFRSICDKEAVLAKAGTLGIAVPGQKTVHSVDEAMHADIRFPVVLKPARSVGEVDGRRVKLGVRHARDAVELARVLEEFDAAAFPLLMQQRIVGPGTGIFLLRWEGEFLAEFAHRRIREKPPSGGVSVYRESILAPPEVLALSRQLLEAFDWRGVAMIEYKLDAATSTSYLMEINGRFWGSLQLAVDAGVDFPELLVRAALGEQVVPVRQYRTGVRSRWWWGDVDQLLLRLRRSNADLDLPPDSGGRLAAIADFCRIWRHGDRNEILRVTDASPFVRETIDWFARR